MSPPLRRFTSQRRGERCTPRVPVRQREVRRIFDTYKSRFGYGEGETLELVSAKSAKAA